MKMSVTKGEDAVTTAEDEEEDVPLFRRPPAEDDGPAWQFRFQARSRSINSSFCVRICVEGVWEGGVLDFL